MVLIFDLDDTLFDERTYVVSGLRAVAAFGEGEFGWNADASFHFMVEYLDHNGRGAVFDNWLKAFGKFSKGLTKKCVSIYRHHIPDLSLFDSAKALLPRLKAYPLYIVTDGHKVVQEKKISALGIQGFFRHVFITHRYGLKNAKPSTHCFELIKRRECCSWKEMMYLGDNPAKDFVNLNRLGIKTIRVLTGVHRNAMAPDGYDAQFTIPDLTYFLPLFNQLNNQPNYES